MAVLSNNAVTDLPPKVRKAERIVAQGRITDLDGARAFAVQGRTDTYVVVLWPHPTIADTLTGACTCAWWTTSTDEQRERYGRACSHILAAQRLVRQREYDAGKRDPFEGIAGQFRSAP